MPGAGDKARAVVLTAKSARGRRTAPKAAEALARMMAPLGLKPAGLEVVWRREVDAGVADEIGLTRAMPGTYAWLWQATAEPL